LYSSCVYFLTLQYPTVGFQQKCSCPDSSAEQRELCLVPARAFHTRQVTGESLAAAQPRVLCLPSHSRNSYPWMFFQDEVSIPGERLEILSTLCSAVVSEIPKPYFCFWIVVFLLWNSLCLP